MTPRSRSTVDTTVESVSISCTKLKTRGETEAIGVGFTRLEHRTYSTGVLLEHLCAFVTVPAIHI